ncbi:hypothetical protein C84B14_11961 [Salinisphaera sp. C84B14]|uniref:DUF6314 family protein n=1 Tax=Salinisphaera sp. C84B14 TaxID=1304155 RepID=UPI0033410BC6
MPRSAPYNVGKTAIIELHSRLADIRRLRFEAEPGPGSHTGWAGHGEAEVAVSVDADGLRFHESGQFTPAATGTALSFRNVYRWVVHDDRIALWHERFGCEAAVWLFDLVAAAPDELIAAERHLCGEDRYDARLRLVEHGFELGWSITGPRKDEKLAYRYLF